MLNRVEFIGHLGRDPETRFTPSGSAVCNFSVASTEKWKAKDGSPMERTEWLRCAAFDKLGEICDEYLKKGSLVFVDGSLHTRQYEKDGVTKTSVECHIRSMKMLGPKPDGSATPAAKQAAKPAGRPSPRAPDSGTGFDSMDDDIPY